MNGMSGALELPYGYPYISRSTRALRRWPCYDIVRGPFPPLPRARARMLQASAAQGLPLLWNCGAFASSGYNPARSAGHSYRL